MEKATITKETALAILNALGINRLRIEEMLDTCESLSVGDASYWRASLEQNENARSEIMRLRWEW